MFCTDEFYFIRHGQTDGNIFPEKRIYHDLPLNITGIQQAEKIKDLIGSLPLKSVCYSPLQRARQTKEISCKHLLDVSHYEVSDLTECSLSTWYEMNRLKEAALCKKEGEVFDFMNQVIKGAHQAFSFEGPVLIVAHGGVFWALSCLLNLKMDWYLDHCIPVHVFKEQGQWKSRYLV